MNHHRKRVKYMFSHICKRQDGMWMVFERGKEYLGKPIAMGSSQGEAIENASAIKGVKHYMIEVVDDG